MPKKTGNSPDQLPLLGFESCEEPREPPLISVWPEAQPKDILFFGVLVESITAEKIKRRRSSLISEQGLSGKLIAAERLHVSLVSLGSCLKLTNQQVEIAKRAASTVTLPFFSTFLDRALSFPMQRDAHPFALKPSGDVAEMKRLRKTLIAALRGAHLEIELASFTPHITLLYDKQLVAEQAIEPIELTVREFVLIHSHFGKSRYTVLARWPLQERHDEVA